MYVTPCVKVFSVRSEGHIASASQGGGGHIVPPGEGAKEDIDMEEEW